MKKLFTIAIISCIIGAGCIYAHAQGWFKDTWPAHIGDTRNMYMVREFSYKGHEYIHFTARGSYGDAGIVHNPSCRSCRRRY